MTPRALNDRLLERIEAVCRELLPGGRRQGGEWLCGDLSGRPGQSCRVRLSGDKAGVWADFQTNDKGGDLLDLSGAVRRLDLAEVMREAKAWLGVPDLEFEPKRHKDHRRPTRAEGLRRPGKVLEYLRGRGLTDATVAAFQIAEDARGNIVFPYQPKAPAPLPICVTTSLPAGVISQRRICGSGPARRTTPPWTSGRTLSWPASSSVTATRKAG